MDARATQCVSFVCCVGNFVPIPGWRIRARIGKIDYSGKGHSLQGEREFIEGTVRRCFDGGAANWCRSLGCSKRRGCNEVFSIVNRPRSHLWSGFKLPYMVMFETSPDVQYVFVSIAFCEEGKFNDLQTRATATASFSALMNSATWEIFALSFSGGEPLLNPSTSDYIAYAADKGMWTSMPTKRPADQEIRGGRVEAGYAGSLHRLTQRQAVCQAPWR